MKNKKKLLLIWVIILVALFSFKSASGQVIVGGDGDLIPTGPHAAMKIENVEGGFHIASDTSSVPDWIKTNSAVYQTSDSKLYRFSAGTWIEIATGGGGGTDDQTLSFINPNISIEDGNSVDISAIDTKNNQSETAANVSAEWPNLDTDSTDDFDGDFTSLSNIPSGLSDGDDVGASSSGAQYLINVSDGSNGLEASTWSITPAEGFSSLTTSDASMTIGGGSASLSLSGANGSSFTNNTSGNLSFTNNAGNILINGTTTLIEGSDVAGWDQNVADDFDGAFSNLSGIPSGLSDGDDIGYQDNSVITANDGSLGSIAGYAFTNGGSDLGWYLGSGDNRWSFQAGGLEILNISEDGITLVNGTIDDASNIESTASGNLTSTNVQSALEELQGDIDGMGGDNNDFVTSGSLLGTDLTLTIPNQTNPVIDLSGLQDGTGTDDQNASEVTVSPAVNGETDVQASLEDHETRINALAGGGATQLSELSDVNTSTATNRNVLVADGVDFESRALVEADISDLQSYLTTEANDLGAAVTWANVPDGNITQSSVTQHQTALSITESQISDLSHTVDTQRSEEEIEDFVGGMVTGNTEALIAVTYDDAGNSLDFVVDNDLSNYDNGTSGFISSEANNLSTVTWVNVPDVNITESSVTQHESALTITESQISDLGTYLTDVVNDATPQLGGNLDGQDNNISNSNFIPRNNALTSGSTLTPNADYLYNTVTLAEITTVNAPTGGVDLQQFCMRIHSTSAYAITWNAIYQTMGNTLPTTTVANKTIYVYFTKNDVTSTFDLTGVQTQD